jgi:hypothetical protein
MQQLFGALPPEYGSELVEILPELPFYTLNGEIVEVYPQRSKRSTNPQCQNLPSYKNWVEEGKTTPVRNQGSCGMEIVLRFLFKFLLNHLSLSFLLRLHFHNCA